MPMRGFRNDMPPRKRPAPPALSRQVTPPDTRERADSILLSILIPTLTNRAEMLAILLQKLESQIAEYGAHSGIQIVTREDEGQESIGAKRNALLEGAQGRFVIFVDDDDDVSDDYVHQLRRAILDHPDIDCIGMRAIMSRAGKETWSVVYSLRYSRPSSGPRIYFRPPQHITAIRREIALHHKFPDVRFGEDSSWAERIFPELKKEHFIDKVLYHYRFNVATTATQVSGRHTVDPDNFSIVIPSARPENLIACVRSIVKNEPALNPERIIVIDDGALAGAQRELPKVTWVPGQKPFVYSRAINSGVRWAPGDVILLNDDAVLETKFGLTSLSYALRTEENVGVCSAAIEGFVGNQNQRDQKCLTLRPEREVLVFICVYIPRSTITKVGDLDERFVGYGWDDNDYCKRVLQEDLRLVIYDGCVVRHGENKATSTFRSRPDIDDLHTLNRELFLEKWNLKQ